MKHVIIRDTDTGQEYTVTDGTGEPLDIDRWDWRKPLVIHRDSVGHGSTVRDRGEVKACQS